MFTSKAWYGVDFNPLQGVKVIHRFTQFTDRTMAQHKRGITFNCIICGKPFYRPNHNVIHGTKKTCGDKECGRLSKSRENNPFWGKKHSPETVAKIKESRAKNPPKGTGPKKGEFKHTAEAKRLMSIASKERWRTRRADMMAARNNGLNAPYKEIQNEPRHRFIFTPEQKRTWTADRCKWCDATEELVLDHIIPVICGGTNIRANAQTLCGECNRWKMRHVDRPLYFALLGANGAQINPEYHAQDVTADEN
jgi:hypothetical protein